MGRRGEPPANEPEPPFQFDFTAVLLIVLVAVLIAWMFADFWLHR